MKEKPRMKVPRPFGGKDEFVSINQALVEDRARLRELFASSYAQYIVEETGDPGLKAELDRARLSNGARLYPEFWTTEDFVPIRKAMDELMRILGWRN
jgi:hypothetical protein